MDLPAAPGSSSTLRACAVFTQPPPALTPVSRGAKGECSRASRGARERLRELVEENAEEVWAAYLEALTASTADGLPDYRARYQAASALLAEAYGKPMQPTHEQGGVTFIVERPPRGKWEIDPASSSGLPAAKPA